jgi:hypothetical protein
MLLNTIEISSCSPAQHAIELPQKTPLGAFTCERLGDAVPQTPCQRGQPLWTPSLAS